MTKNEARRNREAADRIAKALRQIAADLPALSAQASDPFYDLLDTISDRIVDERMDVPGALIATAQLVHDAAWAPVRCDGYDEWLEDALATHSGYEREGH